ncbi:hypothetical protein RvY_18281 [Ramazzottius varieornatus]|uniref:GST N-terminal domain-containing protein n=1 Tax=Ramazzottius varieornatus TaxID=947166 RepID=A0A1D1W5P9_RAMVA|nr:hypothetical protein RvY_18281 [Ramazzottius varieornatus]
MAGQNGKLPHPNAQLVLYYYPLSYYSQKVRMALLEKGIPHALEFIDINSGENYEAWFVKLNPECEVPVLRDGTRVVADSARIIDYLEENYSDAPYAALSPPKSSIEYHKFKYLREAIDAVPVEYITYGTLKQPALLEKTKVPNFVKKGLGDRFFQRQKFINTQMEKHPEYSAIFSKKLSRVLDSDNNVGNTAMVNAKLNELESLLDRIEEHLRLNSNSADRKNWWLCSEKFTTADISLSILLSRCYLLGLAPRFWSISRRPYLAMYYQRINERPSFQKVAITHITTSDLLQLGGSTILYAYGLQIMGVATVLGALAIGGYVLMKRRR